MPPSARGRKEDHRRSSVPIDPLTAAIQLCVTPIFYLILFIVHLCYYIYLKTISSVRLQRRIFLGIRDKPLLLWQGWLDGLGIKQAGLRTAQQASEERLLKRGNVVRTKGRLLNQKSNKIEMLKVNKKQRPIAPRHLALCLARSPIRTSTLIYRAIGAIFFQKKVRNTSGCRKERSKEFNADEFNRAIESVKTCLRCAALVGVEEVTIYDEDGLIQRLLENKSEWILNLPIIDLQHWESISTSNSTPAISTDKFAASHTTSDPFSISDCCNTDKDRPHACDSSTSTDRMVRVMASLQRPQYEPKDSKYTNGFHKKADDHHCRLTVNLLGPQDAKGAIAKAATAILKDQKRPKIIDVKAIDLALQAHNYPSEPDLLIIHGGSRGVQSLHGFPPWLVRLCEIFKDVNASPHHPITAVSIEAAIISFSQSEQRYGR